MLKVYKFVKKRDKVMKAVFLLSSIFSIIALLAICVFLLASGVPAIAKIGFFKFIFGTDWAPLAAEPSYGILPMIAGSIYVTVFATAIGVTLGLFTAVFLYKFCPKKIAGAVRQLVNLLAGIPSVIYGLFGLVIIVPFLREISPNGVGHGILAASIILSIMILPTIVSISLDALNAVPKELFEGALALGATKEQSIFKVMLPAAKSGVFASVVLSVGRAIGETMAVIMVIGGSTQMPVSVFQSVRTMTANIAMGALEFTGDAFDALIATGVVLFIFALLLNVGFAVLKNGSKEKEKKRKKRHAHKAETNKIQTDKSESSNAETNLEGNTLTIGRIAVFAKLKEFIKGVKIRLTPGKGFYKFLKGVCLACTLIAVAALISIIVFILSRGIAHINFNFIFGQYASKAPTIRPALLGTLYLIVTAIAIAVPVGILSAIYLTEYAKKGRLVRFIRVAAETLAAIPSIVYGLFGYLVFVVFFGWGYSLLGGGITLAVMVLPTIIRSTEESLLAVPLSYREGSYALGASKVRTIFSLVLPNASAGIFSAIVLSIGRVVSESAVLILTIGMVVNNTPNSITNPGTSLALDVYYFGSHGYPEQAAATAVVLLVLVVGINLLAAGLNKLLTKGKK